MTDSARRTGALAILIALILAAAPGHAWQGVPVWTATEELRIGSVDDPATSFSLGLRVAVGRAGEVFAMDPERRRISVFDARGRLARAFGREGAGPGEFNDPRSLGWLGDTLWVSDPLQQRVTFFRRDGSVIRTFRIMTALNAAWGPRAPEAMLADGSGLTIPGPPAGVPVDRIPLLRVDRDGEPIDTLTWFPLGAGAILAASTGSRKMFVYTPDWLRDGLLVAPAPDGRSVVTVDRTPAARPGEARFRVTRYSARGDTLLSRSYRYTPTPTPRDFRSRWAGERAAMLAQSSPGLDRRELERNIHDGLKVPAFHPPVTAAVAGRDGTLWLRREETEGVASVFWHVLNERGDIVADVRLPKNVQVHQASRTHLWAVVHDELDVPYVVRYRVGPPGRPADADVRDDERRHPRGRRRFVIPSTVVGRAREPLVSLPAAGS